MKKLALTLFLGLMVMAASSGAALAACTISDSTIVFGTYDVLNFAPHDIGGNIVYRCSGGSDRNISVTLNRGGATSFATRRMLNGSTQLFYNLYMNAARTVLWGDGTEGTQFYFNSNPPNNQDINLPIYGRIPGGQDVGVGSYTNTIIMTINF